MTSNVKDCIVVSGTDVAELLRGRKLGLDRLVFKEADVVFERLETTLVNGWVRSSR